MSVFEVACIAEILRGSVQIYRSGVVGNSPGCGNYTMADDPICMVSATDNPDCTDVNRSIFINDQEFRIVVHDCRHRANPDDP